MLFLHPRNFYYSNIVQALVCAQLSEGALVSRAKNHPLGSVNAHALAILDHISVLGIGLSCKVGEIFKFINLFNLVSCWFLRRTVVNYKQATILLFMRILYAFGLTITVVIAGLGLNLQASVVLSAPLLDLPAITGLVNVSSWLICGCFIIQSPP